MEIKKYHPGLLTISLTLILFALIPLTPSFSKEWQGKFKDGTVISQQDLQTILDNHKKWIDDSKLEKYRAYLSGAYLVGAALSEANLENTKIINAKLNGVLFEPKNINKLIFLNIEGLSDLDFTNYEKVVELRKIAKESGFRNEEKSLTASLRKYRKGGRP